MSVFPAFLHSLVSPCLSLWVAVLVFLPGRVYAHGEDYWNDFVINNKNDQVEISMAQVTRVLGDVARSRRQVTSWPDPEIRSLQINLEAMQEEIDAMLIHLKEADGIYLQLASALRENPQAGRSVAGSHALEMAIELLDYVSTLEGPEAFAEELKSDGVSVYMIDLMDAYTDTMGVYKTLQESQQRLVEMNAAAAGRTAMSDFRFHLRRLLVWAGFAGLATSLEDGDVSVQRVPAAAPSNAGTVSP